MTIKHPTLQDAFARYDNAVTHLQSTAAKILRAEILKWSKKNPRHLIEYCNEMGSCVITVTRPNGEQWQTFPNFVLGHPKERPHPLRELVDQMDDLAGKLTYFNSLVVGTISAKAGAIIEDTANA